MNFRDLSSFNSKMVQLNRTGNAHSRLLDTRFNSKMVQLI